ncbi:hypothetical protein DGWBC_1113 [Dehalogenimonas sp. WBC-2]|nr:hypothetical protein DGWBC_1113 [Dehalogenimonas sp. WBC-2]
MVQNTAEKVVGLFETTDKYGFEEVLNFVKKQNHISAHDLEEIKRQAEIILTYDLLERERGVDVC